MSDLITETISRVVHTRQPSEDDRVIADLYNSLSIKVLQACHAVVDEQITLMAGTGLVPDHDSGKLFVRIIDHCLRAAPKMAHMGAKEELSEHRLEFERLLDRVTAIPEVTHVVTSEQIIDVVHPAVPRPTDHPDDEE